MDIEYIARRKNLDRLLRSFLDGENYMKISKLTETKKLEEFYRHWTVNEAVLKAKGTGVTQIRQSNERSNWTLFTKKTTSNYMLSIASTDKFNLTEKTFSTLSLLD